MKKKQKGSKEKMPLNTSTKYKTRAANISPKRHGLDPNAVYITETNDKRKAFEEAKRFQDYYGTTKRVCLCDDHTGGHPLYMDQVDTWEDAVHLMNRYDQIEKKAEGSLFDTVNVTKHLNRLMSRPTDEDFGDLQKIFVIQDVLQNSTPDEIMKQTENIMAPLIQTKEEEKEKKQQARTNRMLHTIRSSCTAGEEFVAVYEKTYKKPQSQKFAHDLNSEIIKSHSDYKSLQEARTECDHRIRERVVDINIQHTEHQYIKMTQIDDLKNSGIEKGAICVTTQSKSPSQAEWEEAFEEAKELQEKYPNKRICLCDDKTGARPIYMDTVKSAKDARNMLNRYDNLQKQADASLKNTKEFTKVLNETMADPSKKGFQDMQNVIDIQNTLQHKSTKKIEADTKNIMKPLMKSSKSYALPSERKRAKEMLNLIEDSCTAGTAFVNTWERYAGHEKKYENDFAGVFKNELSYGKSLRRERQECAGEISKRTGQEAKENSKAFKKEREVELIPVKDIQFDYWEGTYEY